MESAKRNKIVDAVRGIAMTTVVLGHSGFPYTQHLYLFHMGLFLFLSGYCYNKKNNQNLQLLRSYFGRKIVSLYLPYVIFTGLVNLLYNKLIDIGFFTNNPNFSKPVEYRVWWKVLNTVLYSFHFEGFAAEQLCGAAWFVIVLIEIVFFFSIVSWIIKLIVNNEHIQDLIMIGISVYFLYLGNYLREHNLVLNDFLSISCSCLILYTGGVMARTYLPSLKSQIERRKRISASAIFIICIIAIVFEERHGHISLGSNDYPSPLFMLLCTTTGILMCFSLAIMVSGGVIEKLLAFIGQHTMFILFLHFAAFKIVSIIQVIIYRKEWYEVATFPVLITEKGWWIAYTITGLTIPTLINVLWKKLKMGVMKLDTFTYNRNLYHQ